MARPRKDQVGPTAFERMREVFWELLEEKPYSAITVKLITQRAGVNHNTFYYHFQNIDDMAMRFFEDNVPAKLVDMVVDAFMGGSIDIALVGKEPNIEEHYRRIRAVMRSGSPTLMQLGKERLMRSWMERAGLGEDELSAADKARINYVWGGITAVVGSEEAKSIDDYVALLQSGIVDAVGILVRRMGEEHGVVAPAR